MKESRLMQKRIALPGLLLALIVSFYLFDTTNTADAVDKQNQSASVCLSCHGPFEKLADQKPGFKTDTGLVNPHQFVPHKEKKAENVPNCLNCHTPHSNPPKEKVDLSSVNVESCYVKCHHMQNFGKCNKCHGNR